MLSFQMEWVMTGGPSALKPAAAKESYDIMSAPYDKLDQLGLKQLFPTIRALAEAGADEQFAKWVREPGNAGRVVQLYRDSIDDRDLVVIPDISSREMLQQLIKKMGRQFTIDRRYLDWDFLVGEHGKCYEAFQWNGGECTKSRDVWNHFQFFGADGNVAAFTAWLLKHGATLEERYVTLPSDSSKLYQDPESGQRLIPDFAKDGDGAVNQDEGSERRGDALCLEWEQEEASEHGFNSVIWVAFREAKNV